MVICPECGKVNGHPKQVNCMACGKHLLVHLNTVGWEVKCGRIGDKAMTGNLAKVTCPDCLK